VITDDMVGDVLPKMVAQLPDDRSVPTEHYGVETDVCEKLVETLLPIYHAGFGDFGQMLQIAFLLGAVCGRKDAVDALEDFDDRY